MTLKCNSTSDVFHYTYLNELLTIKSSFLLLTHQTPKYTLLQSFVYFKSPVPALFASFEVSMLSLKFACFREFSFCPVAAKFANLHAPTRLFGQRLFAIFSASVVVSVQSDCVSLLVTVSSLQHALFMGSCHFCGASLRAGSLFRVREKVLKAEPRLREENWSSTK